MQSTTQQLKQSAVQQLKQKLSAAEKDNEQLTRYIEQLNSCYGQKIALLESNIQSYKVRLEQLLTWKKDYIEEQLFDNSKYEEQNRKLIGIVDELTSKYNDERLELEIQIEARDKRIRDLTQQNENLMAKNQENEQKVEELVRDHMREIQQMKNELIQLKAEITETESEYYQEKSSKVMLAMSQQKEEDPPSRAHDDQQENQSSSFGLHSGSYERTLKQLSCNSNPTQTPPQTRVKKAQSTVNITQPENINILPQTATQQ